MSADALQRDLLAVPGVAAARLDDAIGSSRGVRVVLAPGAVAAVVGPAVQRVLAEHGITARMANGSGPAAATVVEIAPEPIGPATLDGEPVPDPAGGGPTGDGVGSLASLMVEESADEVLVVATATDGRRYSRNTRDGGAEGVAAAVVAAVGALVDGRAPQLVSVAFAVSGGSEVVTVVVERRDGSRHAGAAVVRAGRPYAVARATWAALRS